MRCEVSGAPLEHEAWVAEGGDENTPRERLLRDLKSVEWIQRSGMHDNGLGCVAATQAALRRWIDGAEKRFPLQAQRPGDAAGERRGGPAGPEAPRECLTTKTHTHEQMDEVYREVMLGGLPVGLPEDAVRRLLSEHGEIVALRHDAEAGVAAAAFAAGRDGESFYVSCNRMPLPPALGGRESGENKRSRLHVEFAQYLNEVNPNLYDELFGSKATRQLLRAMPRRMPTPTDAGHADGVLQAWRRCCARREQEADFRAAEEARETDSSVLIAANWVSYKYNEEEPYRKAQALLSASGGDLGRALDRLEHSHIDRIVRAEEERAAKAAAARRRPRAAKSRCERYAARVVSVHAVAVAALVGVIVWLLRELLRR